MSYIFSVLVVAQALHESVRAVIIVNCSKYPPWVAVGSDCIVFSAFIAAINRQSPHYRDWISAGQDHKLGNVAHSVAMI